MKVTKLQIKNLFGVKELALDDKSVELTGTNGAGKSSVLDSIRYALTNSSERSYIINKGSSEGEITIETDSGLNIKRKKREDKADYKSIKDNNIEIGEGLLRDIFTILQLNPIDFCQMKESEQNRILLDLIKFEHDIREYIVEQFGELVPLVNYDQNILQVLWQIQSDKGHYYIQRHLINQEIRSNNAVIEEIAEDIPENYNAQNWQNYSLASVYTKIERIRAENSKIHAAKQSLEQAKQAKDKIERDKEHDLLVVKNECQQECNTIESNILTLESQIKLLQQKLEQEKVQLDVLPQEYDKKINAIAREYKAKTESLDKEIAEKEILASGELVDYSQLQAEAEYAESMKAHLQEYNRMVSLQEKVKDLVKISQNYTDKIEKARNLPSEIVESCEMPIKNLTVENGIPLVSGLPVSNLSDGEKLRLCVDIVCAKENNLQLILLDRIECLSDTNRELLYKTLKDKKVQFIASRTTNENELTIREI